jgi:hypothetical protein
VRAQYSGSGVSAGCPDQAIAPEDVFLHEAFQGALHRSEAGAGSASAASRLTQNVYGKSWREERVDAVTRAVEAVSSATADAEKAEAKPDQPETFSEQRVPLWGPQQEAKIASC